MLGGGGNQLFADQNLFYLFFVEFPLPEGNLWFIERDGSIVINNR